MSASRNTKESQTVILTDDEDPEESGIDSDLVECIEAIDEAVGEFDAGVVINSCLSTVLTLSSCINIPAEEFQKMMNDVAESYRFAIDKRLDRMTAKGNA